MRMVLNNAAGEINRPMNGGNANSNSHFRTPLHPTTLGFPLQYTLLKSAQWAVWLT